MRRYSSTPTISLGTGASGGPSQDILDLASLAQVGQSMGIGGPPPMDQMLKLLGVAGDMQNQEQDLALKRQQLDIEQQKALKMSPEMLTAMLFSGQFATPEAQRGLLNKAVPGVLPEPAAPPTEATLPNIGQPAAVNAKRVPKSRLPVQSQAPFMGYTPPQGDVEAVLDDQGNVINFVQRGTQTPVPDFVPTAGSIGGYGASKYATAQQMKALGRFLGLSPRPQSVTSY